MNNNALSPHIDFAIEEATRQVRSGKLNPIAAIALLIRRFPELQDDTLRGLSHPLARISLETEEGKKLKRELGL